MSVAAPPGPLRQTAAQCCSRVSVRISQVPDFRPGRKGGGQKGGRSQGTKWLTKTLSGEFVAPVLTLTSPDACKNKAAASPRTAAQLVTTNT